MDVTWTGLKTVLQDHLAPPDLHNADLVGRWHHERQGHDQSVSNYITYYENLENQISGISVEIWALSQLMGYHKDICEGFSNDNIPLTHEGISQIALKMVSKNMMQLKGRTREGAMKGFDGSSSNQSHNCQDKSRNRS